MAVADPLQRGAPKAENINAWMRVKTMILISNEHREETRIDIGSPRREAASAHPAS